MKSRSIVIFQDKVFSSPYYPFFEPYRHQEFEVVGKIDGHYKLRCTTDPDITVNGIIDEDLLEAINV